MRTLVLTLAAAAALSSPLIAAAPRRFPAPNAAAAPSAAAAQALLADIQRRGAKAVLEDIYGREGRWRPLIEGVTSGQAQWLQVAAALKPTAKIKNLSAAQDLTVAVSRALEHSPANVLRVLDAAFDTDGVCSLNTVEDSLGSDYRVALAAVERRERAVARVQEADLTQTRDDCLSFLKELKGEVVRNREAWFPAR
jgi:hypothetical protein